jgi:hypothetical protein
MSVLGSKVLLLPNMLTVLMDVWTVMRDNVDSTDQVGSRDDVWKVYIPNVVCCYRREVAPHIVCSA